MSLVHCIRLQYVGFEHYRATFSKPGDRLPGRRKPRVATLQILNKITLRRAPQPLRSETAIMPVDRQAASKLDHIVRHAAEECRTTAKAAVMR
jgi:hypothetical protein